MSSQAMVDFLKSQKKDRLNKQYSAQSDHSSKIEEAKSTYARTEALLEIKNALLRQMADIHASIKNLSNKVDSADFERIDKIYSSKQEISDLKTSVLDSINFIKEDLMLFGKKLVSVNNSTKNYSSDLKSKDEVLNKKISSLVDEIDLTKKEFLKSISKIKTSREIPKIMFKGTVQRQLNIPVTVDQGGTGRTDNNYIYIHGSESVDGSWRFSTSGTDLIAERRESGVWVNKGGFTA